MPLTLQANKKTTISGDFAAGATSLTLATAAFTNFTNGYLTIDYDNDSKYEIVNCTVTGTAVSSITRGQDGTSDVAHSSGAKIGFMFVPSHFSDIAPVLGYAEVTASQGSLGTAANDLTSLTTTVTVPKSARRIKITAKGDFNGDTTGAAPTLRIKEGATVLATAAFTIYSGAAAPYQTLVAVYVSNSAPSSGSHTYKLDALTSAGSMTMAAAATNPAFILVEYL